MLHFIGGLIAGLVGVIVALFGIGIGLGAMLLALSPLIVALLILLLPVLILVAILRRIGLLGGPFITLLVIIGGVFLLMGGAHHLWQGKTDHVTEWLDAKRDQLEECHRSGGDVTITIDGGDMVITCNGAKPEKPQGDAHI